MKEAAPSLVEESLGKVLKSCNKAIKYNEDYQQTDAARCVREGRFYSEVSEAAGKYIIQNEEGRRKTENQIENMKTIIEETTEEIQNPHSMKASMAAATAAYSI